MTIANDPLAMLASELVKGTNVHAIAEWGGGAGDPGWCNEVPTVPDSLQPGQKDAHRPVREASLDGCLDACLCVWWGFVQARQLHHCCPLHQR